MNQAGPIGRALSLPFIAMIRVYQWTLSPIIGRQCRYEPTCSRYAVEAYRTYGPLAGSWMTAKRICRCHPFVKGGYDPVPVPDDWQDPPGPGAPSDAESPHTEQKNPS